MKKQNPNVCPGCSRSCAADAVRCKRGRKYFAELSAAVSAPPIIRDGKKHKWERLASEDGLLRQLLITARTLKHLLRGGVSEDRLLATLSDEERGQLAEILSKLSRDIQKFD